MAHLLNLTAVFILSALDSRSRTRHVLCILDLESKADLRLNKRVRLFVCLAHFFDQSSLRLVLMLAIFFAVNPGIVT